MKKIHLLPNLVTACGMTCGLFVIFKMATIPAELITEETLIAISGFLLLAAFFDLLDGALARAMQAESEFGGLFDSLADTISFGVAPSLIFLKIQPYDPGTPYSFFITSAALTFSVSGVLRLVRFNVNANKIKGNAELEKANKQNFTGLPIPAAAACAVSLILFTYSVSDSPFFNPTYLQCSAMIFLGYLMISRLKFPSPKTLQMRVNSFRSVFIVVLLSVILFYGLLHHFPLLFFLLSWSYLTISLILSFIRILAGRRSKKLEAFEPEPDEIEDEL